MAGYVRCWGAISTNPIRSNTDGYVEVAADVYFACGRRSNGVVDCWSSGTNYIPTPPTVPDGDRDGEPVTFLTISANQSHVCGIQDGQHGQTEGLLKCWKALVAAGAEGDKLTTLPTELQARTFSAVSAGAFGTCALAKGGTDDGTAKCWGQSSNITVPEELTSTAFSDIGSTGLGGCGIVRDGMEAGQIRCWGPDFAGEIDDAPTMGTFSSLDMGNQHACALKTDATPVCWGRSMYGETPIPAELSGATFSEVSAGHFHSCGILDGQNGQTAGTVQCWGGQNPKTLEYPVTGFDSLATVPYEARLGLPALSARPGMIDASRFHTCAVTDAGGLACWGSGDYGPPRVASDIRQISTGVNHSCALKTDGKVECWGNDSYAQSSGNVEKVLSARVDATVGADLASLTFAAVSAGFFHSCGILDGQNMQTAGSLRCWGWNGYKQAVLPTELAGATFAAIAAEGFHTCGILDGQNTQTAGLLRCWGSPIRDNEDYWNVEQAVVPASLAASTFVKLSSGIRHNCGILDGQNGQAAGTLRCWGRNNDVSSEHAAVPADLADTAFTDVSVGRYHTCGVTTVGRLACWWNLTGTTYSAGQVEVPEQYRYARFAAVAAGDYHTCAVTAEGKAACWGSDAMLDTPGVQVARATGIIINTGQADPLPPAPGAARPTVTLALSDTAISESGGTSRVTATLDRPSVGTTTITVTASSDAAIPGRDFTLNGGPMNGGPTLTIAAGKRSPARER